MEMKKWASKVKRTIKEDGGGRGKRKSTNLAIVSANNHYAAFWSRNCQYIQKDGAIAGSYMGKRGEGRGQQITLIG